MIHSARQARPTSTFRRTASSTPSFNTSADDFSRQFAFHHLLASPLPSPALPSIVPRHGKKPTSRVLRTTLRVLYRLTIYVSGLLLTYWLLSFSLRENSPSTPSTPQVIGGQGYKSSRGNDISQDATSIIVEESSGTTRWSISISPYVEFPLRPSQYAALCAEADHIAKQLREPEVHNHHHSGSRGYYQTDSTFIDVREAVKLGFLPAVEESKDLAGYKSPGDGKKQKAPGHRGFPPGTGSEVVCERTLTFVLEGVDAGLGKTLMGLWMSYGLATEEGRAFFIDDAHWAYGQYTTFFASPPKAPCLPPPSFHRVPFPHQARHLVISASTYPWAFGHSFDHEFQDSHAPKSLQSRKAFALARAGHDALFHLATPDADYLSARLLQLESNVRSKGGITVGLHVRRGDCRPWEVQYSDSYIPLSTFSNTAQDLISSKYTAHDEEDDDEGDLPAVGSSASRVILASDDPDVYTASELVSTERAQSQILLASKSALDAVRPSSTRSEEEPAFVKFVEPNVGWEGGFFASVFWGLGNAAAGRSAARGLREERAARPPSEETLKLREYVARAYLLELKVLGQADRVVCGASSMGCRLLGVMKGWEKGMVAREWVNVDGGVAGWVGLSERDWAT
ncbi:MAG: hypothetical protein Q9167_002558 [Letrouitia subvulpina]